MRIISMVGFVENIEEKTLANFYFRHVLYTSQHAQVVVMSLKPGEDIGMETHETVDQFCGLKREKARQY
jgi:mannose-6-phosphate isomerase-like protein (cupin superfamily)